MIQPLELKLHLPMKVANAVWSTTTDVWNILVASRDGNLQRVKELVAAGPELIYAQYNYTPPIHFAVREGHTGLVKYLLDEGALDPTYRMYPFLESLLIMAQDREYTEIASILDEYINDPSRHKYKGDNGEIDYNKTPLQKEFEQLVDKGDVKKTKEILKKNPEFATDNTFFWGEGPMMMVAKEGNTEMVDLLMHYGAKVPAVLKWAQFYYFERYDMTTYLLEKGANPEVMSWHHVSILHDMAQKGNIPRAELFIKHGAPINTLEEEYCSTPLGMAVRWGHEEMVSYLLQQGADPNKAAAQWATPLAWARKKGHAGIEEILLKAGAK
jgi:ankyrin repeat protein